MASLHIWPCSHIFDSDNTVWSVVRFFRFDNGLLIVRKRTGIKTNAMANSLVWVVTNNKLILVISQAHHFI